MLVLADYESIEAIHTGVALAVWDDGQRASPLPMGSGFLVRGVHLVKGVKGLSLGWRDANGQRMYLAVEDAARNADGVRMFRSSDSDYFGEDASATVAFYGADELTAIQRQLKWHELPCEPDEIPYIMNELMVGND